MPIATVNGDVYYETGGQGPPLLLVTGSANVLEWFRPWLEELGRSHTWVGFDYPGVGRSGPAERLSIAGVADAGLGLMDLLGHERFSVVGLSMGGMVTQELLVRRTGRLDRAVLVSSGAGRLPDEVRTALTTRPELNPITANKDKPPEERFDGAAPSIFSQRFLRSDRFPELRDWSLRYQSHPDVLGAYITSALDHDTLDRLREVDDVPVLVITGTEDQIAVRAFSEELAAAIPHSQLVALAGGSHGITYEYPKWMVSVVTSFLTTELDYHPAGAPALT